MTKQELIEQRVEQLVAQNWDREHAKVEASRLYADYADEVEEEVKPVRKPAKKAPASEATAEGTAAE